MGRLKTMEKQIEKKKNTTKSGQKSGQQKGCSGIEGTKFGTKKTDVIVHLGETNRNQKTWAFKYRGDKSGHTSKQKNTRAVKCTGDK